ncbi:YihY/virulence factor BrkB family protein [Agromyces agglutinans]|uniref:YihY/virulence factor BrkB family protein n=1 Tax=Agromyces agglutinans TaxID=2662258 RepID=UPI001299A66E|nr:YihY/virulence factor BrkB family protein [Agromyces agglutinans]
MSAGPQPTGTAVNGPANGHTDSPIHVSGHEWRLILVRTWHEFRINQSYDIAAALTYYATLTVFPAALAALSLLGAFGTAEDVTRNLLQVLADLDGEAMAAALAEPVEQLLGASHQWVAIFIGIGGALWSISGYLGVLGRGMNRILDVEEGRPFWESRPIMIAVAAAVLVLVAAITVLLLLSGPAADSVARTLGLDEGVVFWWDLAKIPVLVALMAATVALLYWATPNVRRRNFRWLSVGAAAAIITWAILTALFGWYVLGFDAYEQNYGVLGGAVAFLLWVGLSNLAILFGAVLDTEVERVRQLRAGIDAEEDLQLPLRDDRLIRKNREQRNADILAAAALKPSSAVDGSL